MVSGENLANDSRITEHKSEVSNFIRITRNSDLKNVRKNNIMCS